MLVYMHPLVVHLMPSCLRQIFEYESDSYTLDFKFRGCDIEQSQQDLKWPRLTILFVALSGSAVIFVKIIGNAAEMDALITRTYGSFVQCDSSFVSFA